ncbi:hypothetical protein JD844_005117 [Phrynosoma platyrhinos]|uniref:RAB, member RAS oncogene family like 6 n=1 Tax=Phrynosoma platyrhinos TaxID=52577 RepID=A0ABQ7SEB1_PHRPL|nr:hypothetical protein JD844_005117 [Phrynosoma platyrhinos]
MFSALKKLVGSEQASGPGAGRERPIPAGLQSMNQALQRRFAKGVQYNTQFGQPSKLAKPGTSACRLLLLISPLLSLFSPPSVKIVIRGDRNTGKTTLWHRLQGKKFVEEYIPTQEIQVTSIHWNYKSKLGSEWEETRNRSQSLALCHRGKVGYCQGSFTFLKPVPLFPPLIATDDIVKVEVWDVVDKGKCKKRGDGLKLENDPQEAEAEMALDAEFLDVYKNCNGVVMMFDITKQWTFNYILRELPKVPTHVPVCVLGNYRDMGEHRVILPDDVREFIDNLNRPPGSSYFRYAESSMKNSFGLKYLHKFFNIPFLQLQVRLAHSPCRDRRRLQMQWTGWEGELMPEGDTPVLPPDSQPPPVITPSVAATAAPPPKRSIISRLFGMSSAPEVPSAAPDPTFSVPAAGVPPKVQSVEDFVPEEGLDRSFLEDPAPQRDKERLMAKAPHADSDR